MEKSEILILICEYLSNQVDSVKKINNTISNLTDKLDIYNKSLVVLNDSSNKNYIGNSNIIVNNIYHDKAEIQLELQVLKLLKGDKM